MRYSFDILCKALDTGTTATEVVNYFQQNIIENTLSFDDMTYPSDSPSYGINMILNFFSHTIDIYHKWRIEISKKLKDTDDPLYLTNITGKNYAKQIHDLIKDDEELRDLYQARNIIVGVYERLLFDLHDKYCFLENHRWHNRLELVSLLIYIGFFLIV